MKRFLIFVILILVSAANVFSQSTHQPKNPLQAQFDSLKKVNRGYYLAGKIDSMPPSNKRLLQLAGKINVDSTFVQAYNLISNYFTAKADYSRGLEYLFKAIETANRGYRKFSALLYGNMAADYNSLGNYEAALQSLHNAQKYLIDGSPSARVYVTEVLATTYVNLKKPDSALKYVQMAFQANIEATRMKIKDPGQQGNVDLIWTVIYRNFAQVYDMLNEPELVNYYYRKAIRFSDSLNIQTTGATTAIFYGRYLLKQKKYDEAKNYGIKCFNIARSDHFKQDIINASGLLYDLYDRQGSRDSAYYYLKINHLYQDSLTAEEKANQLQGLIINQQLKEAEQQAKAGRDAEQRHRNIEYAIIAFGLVVLVILFLLLSRSIIVNTRVIEVVGVIGLLILFEFINLVIHPYLAEFTNDSPLLMLLILVAIAAVIVPLHHRLEHWVKHKLVEKNKTIRLEAAKRTIEKLEGQKSEG
jgi:tetratricopeptide (TPR) repeat protein